ncbi:shikimate kinase [Arthrobacter echini]|uniref:Shikimate kinase n=1 Tax=Arthrobacter echini TaxID=1529066 RepID=A0A4S5E6F6_9MICC|nr:shikimate kinase [Arthrobacter echini]THJ67052.1 shikimate kinase [Arthrobacter echini]
MTPSDTLVLVGPMAVGKTAVGRMIARRTGLAFVDTDRMIVGRYGPIAGIFERHGENHFREVESDVVEEAVAGTGVVSLGGGAVLHPRTQELLARTSVVFLDTDAATVRPRISRDTGRPLLAGDPVARWQELYDQRRPLYAQLATVVVDSRGLSVRGTADAVLRSFPDLPRVPTPERSQAQHRRPRPTHKSRKTSHAD